MNFDKRYNRAISQSLMESYLKCGLAAQRQYIEGCRLISSRMAIGTGVSRAAEVDNKSKIKTGGGISLADIQDIAVNAYDLEINDNEVNESKLEISRSKDRASNAAIAYGERVSPKIQGVIAAEEPITIVIRGIRYAGTPDVITTDGLGDTKAGKPWSQERANRSRQLTGYSMLHMGRYKEFPRCVWIDSLSDNAKGWTASRFWSSRTKSDYDGFEYCLMEVASGLKAGIFKPAAEASWWCSEKWCRFYTSCPAQGH